MSSILEEAPDQQPTISPTNPPFHSEEDQEEDSQFHDAVPPPTAEFNKLTIEKNLERALEMKDSGNSFFREKKYDEAIDCYSRAVEFCPEDEENKETMAICLGNRAAAYYFVEEYEVVIDDCNESLEFKPDYVKVIYRRSQAYEKLDKPEEALADLKKVEELDPSFPKIKESIVRLSRICDERMNKLKDEALGKLKDLGNSILGNFGMSLDNFKMAQDPNTGSWNISMNR